MVIVFHFIPIQWFHFQFPKPLNNLNLAPLSDLSI
jgi:hypothetical protein